VWSDAGEYATRSGDSSTRCEYDQPWSEDRCTRSREYPSEIPEREADQNRENHAMPPTGVRSRQVVFCLDTYECLDDLRGYISALF
jgi:hypothetical protein